MVLSMEIPQDIVDEIIDILHDDSETLKACTSVCRSFRLRSRKHLFSTITIDSPKVIMSLRALLYWRPEISRLVRRLRIWSLNHDTFVQFPLVLSRLKHVQHLELGKQGTYARLDRVLSDYNLMIMEVLKLPQIHTLSLHSIFNFPSAFLRIPPRLAHLNMMHVGCVQSPRLESTIAIPDQPLRTLHVYDLLAKPEWLLPNSLNFERLVMGKSARVAQPIVDAGHQSIEEIIWRNYMFYDYDSIDFSRLRKLQVLSFEILVARDMETPQIKSLWKSVASSLKQGSVSQTLEVLNFAIKPHKTLGYLERDIPYLGEESFWSRLADRSYFPRLRKVTIHLDNEFYDSPDRKDAFNSAIQQNFPLLHATHMLHAALHEDFDWKTFLRVGLAD